MIDSRGKHWEVYRELAEHILDAPPSGLMHSAGEQLSFAACHWLEFDGRNAAKIHAKVAIPHLKLEGAPVIFMYHSYGWASPTWTKFAPYLASGFTVVAMDCRGQSGRSSAGLYKTPSFGGTLLQGWKEWPDSCYVDGYLDTLALLREVEALGIEGADVVRAVGWSQGGTLAMVMAALSGREARIAIAQPFCCGIVPHWNLNRHSPAYEEVLHHMRRGHGGEEAALLEFLETLDLSIFAPHLVGRVEWIGGEVDAVCPMLPQIDVYEALRCEKNLLIMKAQAHEEPAILDRVALTLFGEQRDEAQNSPHPLLAPSATADGVQPG